MKKYQKNLIFIFCFLISTNIFATTFSFSGYLMRDWFGGYDTSSISGFGSLEYDFSSGIGYGIDYPTTTTVEFWPGYFQEITQTSEIYNPDYSMDCINGLGCQQFFIDNLSLVDIGSGIIQWDADIFYDEGYFDSYDYNGPGGGWVTLTPIGDGRYQINGYDYYGYGTQDWGLYGILTPTEITLPSPVPLPSTLWLFISGIMALRFALRPRIG